MFKFKESSTLILLLVLVIASPLCIKAYSREYDNSFATPTKIATGVTITPSGEYLAPDSNKSAVYNSGFSQGYLGFPLKEHHTPIFLATYKNGTGIYWLNRGEAEGYYNIHPNASEKKNSDYVSGWNQGQWIRSPSNVGFDKDFYPRPNQTNDDYLDYYVGVYNGAVAADKDDNAGGDDGTSNYCGSGHTQEYCIGHKDILWKHIC